MQNYSGGENAYTVLLGKDSLSSAGWNFSPCEYLFKKTWHEHLSPVNDVEENGWRNYSDKFLPPYPHPEMILCSWQDVEIQELTNFSLPLYAVFYDDLLRVVAGMCLFECLSCWLNVARVYRGLVGWLVVDQSDLHHFCFFLIWICGCPALTHRWFVASVLISGALLLLIYHGTRRKSLQYYSVLHQAQLLNRWLLKIYCYVCTSYEFLRERERDLRDLSLIVSYTC